MENPLDHFWSKRLDAVKQALEKNNFEAHVAADAAAAGRLVRESILPSVQPKSVAWGGSMTFMATGLYQTLLADKSIGIIDTYDKTIDAPTLLERRRQALLCDVFITGTNAVTEKGQLVNLDMIGNRVAAMTFGPRYVILFVGRNKIVGDLQAATKRIKDIAAPANSMRLDKPNPCAKTGRCNDCSTPERICNAWTITEKSFPRARIKVILINADLGL